jgi:hypothetical protein
MAIILVAESGSGSQAGEPVSRTEESTTLMSRPYPLFGPA